MLRRVRRFQTPYGKAVAASPASIFLARVVANGTTLDSTHISAYTALINGLVTDGIWSKLDALWICATQDVATMRLNLVSSSFALVDVSGSPTFVADKGFLAPSGGIQDTQFNPNTAGGNFSLNAAHAMVWPNQTIATNAGDMGTFGGSGFVFFGTSPTGTAWQASINDASNHSIETTATGKGFYLASRQNSAGFDYYWNNTVSGNLPVSSIGLSTSDVYLGGVNGNGNGNKQISAGSLGGALTSTNAANFYSRLQTYMTAVGN